MLFLSFGKKSVIYDISKVWPDIIEYQYYNSLELDFLISSLKSLKKKKGEMKGDRKT